MRSRPFGTLPDGRSVEVCEIVGGGLTAQILTYGATVQDLRLDGFGHPLVLGSETLSGYLDGMTFFGALVGRFANRIAGGRFVLDGTTHQVPRNWLDRHALHGGPSGTGQSLWEVRRLLPDEVTLGLVLPDGDMGFPGRMQVEATFALPGDAKLAISIRARTDAATPCSFAHHGYFVFDDTGDITNHELCVGADRYLPVDEDLIPTGEIAPVVGTGLDFRKPCPVGRAAIDHNFCLSARPLPLRPVAWLRSPASGLRLTVATTEPGLQVYNGAYIPELGLSGLDGRRYGPFAGIALETQGWPDAPNVPHFPSAILRSEDTYRHDVTYRFDRDDAR